MRASQSLSILQVIFWIIFIGLAVKTGTLIISYGVSIFVNPEGANDLYLGLSLKSLMVQSPTSYHLLVIGLITIFIIKTNLLYQVVQLFQKLKLVEPFTNEVYYHLTKMTGITFLIGVLTYVIFAYAKFLNGKNYEVSEAWEHLEGRLEFIFMGMLLLVVSQIFKRGIEIQEDNELTI